MRCVFMSGLNGKWGNIPDTKNATTGSHSLCLGQGLLGEYPRHEDRESLCLGQEDGREMGKHPRRDECDHMVVFFAFGQ